MGDPRRFKNHYLTPKKMYDKARIIEEKKLKQKYGLRRNKEIWRAKTLLRDFRKRARALIAEENEEERKALFEKLGKYGLLRENAELEDILKLKVEDILERRLQTLVYRKGLAKTPLQARQFIVHGHILINGVRVTVPSYLVKVDEESSIELDPSSPLAKQQAISEEKGEVNE
ncbi:MAG: 30S ribosomal protein S4 [Candidatus Nanohaloarchaeota archaeon]|nr:30S ribosomal protein S4 [Candidatus Nanohaloarchaeota archaeon]